jgi:two-component system nitrogen regulation response regulator NtrX
MYPTILIVDDEPSILRTLGGILSDEGFEVITAGNGYEALKIIDKESPDLVILDIWMPGIDGIETLKEIKKGNPHIQVIIITGHGTIETAVKATKLGAFDFIEKPLSIEKMIVAINNALNFRRLEEENRYLRKKTIEKHSISGASPPIVALKKQIAVAAPTDAWILITGENGTGKELVARTIHQLSARSEHPLVDVNCAMMPDELIESELFGHEKGAFTGATGKKIGKFELAGKGTLFLDEVGDTDLKTQSKLLRVLQEQQYQRVGGSRTMQVQARIIAASNKDLEAEIQAGRFREDLYYRLNVIPIQVPPLRERFEDLALLVETFLEETARLNRSRRKTMSADAVAALRNHSWPGNVRELKNLIERLTIMVEADVIELLDMPAQYRKHMATDPGGPETLFAMGRLADAKKAFEQEFIEQKLREHDHRIEETASVIGVTPGYIKDRLPRPSRGGGKR